MIDRISAVFIATLLMTTAVTAAEFRPLGQLPTGEYMTAAAISGDGRVVVGSASLASGLRATAWAGNVITVLGTLDAPRNDRSAAKGVNYTGTVISGYSSGPGTDLHAFRYENGVFTDLGGGSMSGSIRGTFGYGNAVSTDGAIVVGAIGAGYSLEASRWNGTTYTSLGNGQANGVNGSGTVIVGENGFDAFIWQSGERTLLPKLNGGSQAGAYAVSTDGTTAVGYAANPVAGGRLEAVRWVAGAIASLGVPDGWNESRANAVSADGKTVVGTLTNTFTSATAAFRWTASTGIQLIRDLVGTDAASWSLDNAVGVSADGTVIAGNGTFGGQSQGWIIRLDRPEVETETKLVVAVLPTARTSSPSSSGADVSGDIDFPEVSAYAAVINIGNVTARNTKISLPLSVPGVLNFQTSNAQNTPVGPANTPIDIAPGAIQNFIFKIKPNAAFVQEIPLIFNGHNAPPAPAVQGVNTFLLSAAPTPIPDMLSIVVTPTGDGVLNLDGTHHNAFGGATMNIASPGEVTFTVTDAPFGQPGIGLPVDALICLTDMQGLCVQPAAPAASVTTTVAKDTILTYSVFAASKGPAISLDPAKNRLYVIAKGQNDIALGQTSVAVRSQ